MRFVILLTAFCALLISCQNQLDPGKFRVEGQLTAEEQAALTYEVIRYMGRLPGKASHFTKADSIFDQEYQNIAKNHQLELLYQEGNRTYFLFSRIAPSLKLKRVGIGGFLERNEKGVITSYTEAFRTWKMEEPILQEKGTLLFSKMVSSESLEPYYPQNSGKEEFIEFPDANTHFDTDKRMWISSREDYLESLYHLKGHPEQLQNSDTL